MNTQETILTLKAETPIYGGLTIARLEGKVVMIKGAIPGETVEARIDEEKKDYSLATALRILEPSPDRIEPPCGRMETCGGCQLQFISYGAQVRIKEDVLVSSLKRIAGMDVTLGGSLTGEAWNYRHRGQFKVSGGKVGLFREKSREVVDMDSCPLMTREVNEYFGKAKRLIKGVEQAELHISYGDGATALIKASGAVKADWSALAKGLLNDGFMGASINIDRKLMKFGGKYITLDLAGLKYTVSPMSFFQSNWALNQGLVKLVLEGLMPLEGKTVLDLYSGAGNFSLPIAMRAKKVIAVEENPHAVLDGDRNARINGIKNCKFIRGDAGSLNIHGPVDILITDPPRTGLTVDAIDRILKVSPGRIVYVSCYPATLARDLKRLSARYDLESVRMVDFFPQTYHIESVAFLGLKS